MTIKDFKIAEQMKYRYEQFLSRLNIDGYVDRCITRLKALMEINFNPMLIDPVESSFDYGLWFYRFTANLLLDDIKIYQLTNVRRSGIPTIKYEDRNIRMTWNMVFPEIEILSHYNLKTLSNSKRGQIKANVRNLLAKVDVGYDIDELKARLHDITLHTERKIDIEIHEEIDLGGNKFSFQRWRLGSTILKVVANLFKNDILELVEEGVKESVEEVLQGIKMNE